MLVIVYQRVNVWSEIKTNWFEDSLFCHSHVGESITEAVSKLDHMCAWLMCGEVRIGMWSKLAME